MIRMGAEAIRSRAHAQDALKQRVIVSNLSHDLIELRSAVLTHLAFCPHDDSHLRRMAEGGGP